MQKCRLFAGVLSVCAVPFLLCLQAQQPQPRIVNLPLPVYPPIAVQARIYGQVVVEFTVAQDGSVKSWKRMSGPPLLVRAVTDSLPQSRFACDGCAQQDYTYSLTYEFVLPEDNFAGPCADFHQTGKAPTMPPSTLDSPAHVTVRPSHAYCLVVDPATPRVRSIRCLWLWKCGTQKFPGGKAQTPDTN